MTLAPLGEEQLGELERCLAGGGVAVFPTDTVYGLGCDPEAAAAVERLYRLKGRPADRPAAVMFFSLDGALGALPQLEGGERRAIAALLPGPATLLLPNRDRRFPLACGPEPDVLGLRVPRLGAGLQALEALQAPIMQSSANVSGGPEARILADVPIELREAADLLIDGGELPGLASTVIDLRGYEQSGEWRVLREGPLSEDTVARALAP